MTKRTFELVESTLTIVGKVHLRRIDLKFDVRTLAPRFERLRVREFKVINRSIIFAFAISSVTLALWSARIPGRTVVAVVGGYVALNFLWVAVRWIAPLELERYFDRNGKLAFDVIRERAQGADFDDFTATLRKRIEDTNAVNEPNKAPEPTSGTVTPHADACVAPVPPVAHL